MTVTITMEHSTGPGTKLVSSLVVDVPNDESGKLYLTNTLADLWRKMQRANEEENQEALANRQSADTGNEFDQLRSAVDQLKTQVALLSKTVIG